MLCLLVGSLRRHVEHGRRISTGGTRKLDDRRTLTSNSVSRFRHGRVSSAGGGAGPAPPPPAGAARGDPRAPPTPTTPLAALSLFDTNKNTTIDPTVAS